MSELKGLLSPDHVGVDIDELPKGRFARLRQDQQQAELQRILSRKAVSLTVIFVMLVLFDVVFASQLLLPTRRIARLVAALLSAVAAFAVFTRGYAEEQHLAGFRPTLRGMLCCRQERRECQQEVY